MRPCQRGGMQTINPRHLSRALFLLAVPALLAAGCGGSASTGNKSASRSSDDQQLKYIQCMQQHGVNAQNNGGGVTVNSQPGQGGGQNQLEAASQACKKYQPNGGQASGPPSAQQLDQQAKYVQCLQQRGVPARQQGGSVLVQEGRGTDPSKVQQAQQACQQYAPGGGGGQSGSGS